jgi:uncharacterized Zn finger protein (UPF0148 family)
MKLTVELVRRGGTVLKEACPVCGGVQIRYNGKTYCSSHDDLGPILTTQELTLESVVSNLRGLVLIKVNETAEELRREGDSAKQDRLVALLTKYVDLLTKLPQEK